VSIAGPSELTDEDYIIASGEENLSTHGDYSIVTTPNEHSLCGDITITPSYKPQGESDFSEDLNGQPVSYDPDNKRFDAESENRDLEGTMGNMKLVATLT